MNVSQFAQIHELYRQFYEYQISENQKTAVTLHRIEHTMSALTDQVDAALETLAADDSNIAAAFAAKDAATAIVQAALDASKAGEVADEAELQKALDALNGSHAAFVAATPPVAPPAA